MAGRRQSEGAESVGSGLPAPEPETAVEVEVAAPANSPSSFSSSPSDGGAGAACWSWGGCYSEGGACSPASQGSKATRAQESPSPPTRAPLRRAPLPRQRPQRPPGASRSQVAAPVSPVGARGSGDHGLRPSDGAPTPPASRSKAVAPREKPLSRGAQRVACGGGGAGAGDEEGVRPLAKTLGSPVRRAPQAAAAAAVATAGGVADARPDLLEDSDASSDESSPLFHGGLFPTGSYVNGRSDSDNARTWSPMSRDFDSPDSACRQRLSTREAIARLSRQRTFVLESGESHDERRRTLVSFPSRDSFVRDWTDELSSDGPECDLLRVYITSKPSGETRPDSPQESAVPAAAESQNFQNTLLCQMSSTLSQEELQEDGVSQETSEQKQQHQALGSEGESEGSVQRNEDFENQPSHSTGFPASSETAAAPGVHPATGALESQGGGGGGGRSGSPPPAADCVRDSDSDGDRESTAEGDYSAGSGRWLAAAAAAGAGAGPGLGARAAGSSASVGTPAPAQRSACGRLRRPASAPCALSYAAAHVPPHETATACAEEEAGAAAVAARTPIPLPLPHPLPAAACCGGDAALAEAGAAHDDAHSSASSASTASSSRAGAGPGPGPGPGAGVGAAALSASERRGGRRSPAAGASADAQPPCVVPWRALLLRLEALSADQRDGVRLPSPSPSPTPTPTPSLSLSAHLPTSPLPEAPRSHASRPPSSGCQAASPLPTSRSFPPPVEAPDFRPSGPFGHWPSPAASSADRLNTLRAPPMSSAPALPTRSPDPSPPPTPSGPGRAFSRSAATHTHLPLSPLSDSALAPARTGASVADSCDPAQRPHSAASFSQEDIRLRNHEKLTRILRTQSASNTLSRRDASSCSLSAPDDLLAPNALPAAEERRRLLRQCRSLHSQNHATSQQHQLRVSQNERVCFRRDVAGSRSEQVQVSNYCSQKREAGSDTRKRKLDTSYDNSATNASYAIDAIGLEVGSITKSVTEKRDSRISQRQPFLASDTKEHLTTNDPILVEPENEIQNKKAEKENKIIDLSSEIINSVRMMKNEYGKDNKCSFEMKERNTIIENSKSNETSLDRENYSKKISDTEFSKYNKEECVTYSDENQNTYGNRDSQTNYEITRNDCSQLQCGSESNLEISVAENDCNSMNNVINHRCHTNVSEKMDNKIKETDSAPMGGKNAQQNARSLTDSTDVRETHTEANNNVVEEINGRSHAAEQISSGMDTNSQYNNTNNLNNSQAHPKLDAQSSRTCSTSAEGGEYASVLEELRARLLERRARSATLLERLPLEELPLGARAPPPARRTRSDCRRLGRVASAAGALGLALARGWRERPL